MKHKRVSVGSGRHAVSLTTTVTVDGLVVIIVGGERPHVGAVALGVPRLSLKDSSRVSATTSVLTLVGHRDDEVARPAAKRLAKRLNQAVVVVAGLHIEGAGKEDIRRLRKNSAAAVDLLLKRMNVEAGRHSTYRPRSLSGARYA